MFSSRNKNKIFSNYPYYPFFPGGLLEFIQSVSHVLMGHCEHIYK